MSDWRIDADLLERWRADDRRAGEELFARHGHAVIRFFRTKLPDHAEDLSQETFVRLWQSRDRIQDGQAMRAYVLGIARRVMLEHLRELADQRELDPEVRSVAELCPGPFTILARRTEQRILLEALRRIPLEQQTLLELYFWERLNANELALIMGVPASTMRGRMQRARTLLRAAIDEIAASPELLRSTAAELDDWAAQVRALRLLGADAESDPEQ